MKQKPPVKKVAAKDGLVSIQIYRPIHDYFKTLHDETGVSIRFAINKALEKFIKEAKPPK